MRQLLKALRGKRTLVFIDFEGTQYSHEIIATGLVKAHIDEFGKIIDYDKEGFIEYSIPHTNVGRIVTQMTSLTDEFIHEKGCSWSETIQKIKDYIGEEEEKVLFVCFGSNDPKMIVESNRISHPKNVEYAEHWLSSFFDFLGFISQYIKDEKGNTYSLTNYLKLFNVEPTGESHNPLNDAMDLMHLYQAFIDNPDIVYQEYRKVLNKIKIAPTPIRDIVLKLLSGEDVTSSEFDQKIKEYLE